MTLLIMQLVNFLDIIPRIIFYLKTTFLRLDSVILLGPIWYIEIFVYLN
jgi:hypothetical protein